MYWHYKKCTLHNVWISVLYFTSWVIYLSYIRLSGVQSVNMSLFNGLLVPQWALMTLSPCCKGTFTTAQWLDIKKWPKGLCSCACLKVYWIKQVRVKGLKVVIYKTHTLSLLPVALSDLSFAPPVTIPPSEGLRSSLQTFKLLFDLHPHTLVSQFYNYQPWKLWDPTTLLTMGVGESDSTSYTVLIISTYN